MITIAFEYIPNQFNNLPIFSIILTHCSPGPKDAEILLLSMFCYT